MIRRIRLPNDRELQTIDDNGLHRELVEKCQEDVAQALTALDGGLPNEDVSLEVVVDTLAPLLQARPGIREFVREVAVLGGSTLEEAEIYVAMSRWIIDNQIGRGFDWEATTAPERR